MIAGIETRAAGAYGSIRTGSAAGGTLSASWELSIRAAATGCGGPAGTSTPFLINAIPVSMTRATAPQGVCLVRWTFQLSRPMVLPFVATLGTLRARGHDGDRSDANGWRRIRRRSAALPVGVMAG